MSSDFKPGQGYTREDWDAVDSPELTAEELATARPFAAVFPELAENIRRSRGRPKIEAPKQQISLRLDSEVIEKFKATGKGWQSRINDVLKATKL
ncbi:BrnA antitoxin family protein [Devosia beringensis]|uniref:BrnA antitoxin family protein n=1 Tax=Devosia beringensis TaxID=2657486 RepID=UPI00186B748C|nr:BrnA antitoxin family protein [Devosia beringensis]